MNGIIAAINPRIGFYAVKLEDGEFAVFELLDSHEPAHGDSLSGALDSLGSETLLNVTQRTRFDVFIQDTHCSEARARQMLNR